MQKSTFDDIRARPSQESTDTQQEGPGIISMKKHEKLASMSDLPAHDWAGQYGALAEGIGPVEEYTRLTTKT